MANMADSEEIGRLRSIIYRILIERGTLMASIEKLQGEIKQLESDVTALVNAHSTCPTTEQLNAAVASVQALSTAVKAAIVRDANPSA